MELDGGVVAGGHDDRGVRPSRRRALDDRQQGDPLLPPVLGWRLWRAPTDNDGLKLFLGRTDGWTEEEGKPLGRWLGWGLDDLRRDVRDVTLESTAASPCSGRRGLARHRPASWWSIARASGCSRSGEVVVDEDVVLPHELDDVARVGTTFRGGGGFRASPVVGPGADESYPDRRRAAVFGRWHSTVDGSTRALPRPPGARAAPRHPVVRIRAAGRRSGSARGRDRPHALAFSASHYSADDLWRARDLTELVARDDVVVHLDVAHRGLGT